MITQFDKNSVYIASALYRSARREKRLRVCLAVFMTALTAVFALLCALMLRSV